MTFLDFFAGIGTIRLGFEQAGWTCNGHIEWDKYARQSYNAMHDIKDGEYDGQDIRAVRAADLPRSDLWTFGAPCQDFSMAGNRKGMDGERSSLVKEIFRLIEETPEEDRPQWLLYENVRGMLSSNGGWDFLGIILEMDRLGYDVEWQLLNSKHFGVPQNRERVFTIGHLRGRGGRKVFPITGALFKAHETENITLIDKGVKLRKIDISNCITAREDRGVSNRTGEGTAVVYGLKRNQTKNAAIGGLYTRNSKAFYRGILDGASRTLRSNQHDAAVALMQSDKIRIRKLTPLECWRLQGVPDEYFHKTKAAGVSDSQLYKQAGNACTVNVIYAIARAMGDFIK